MAVSQAATVFELDTSSKAHELDNLYVVDTCFFFLHIGAGNPALTAITNALRVGDHIQQRIA
jgi:choline dehydrogenase-like flavoprotein